MSTEKDLISLYYISDKEPEYTSSHVKISCRIGVIPPEVGKSIQNKSTKNMKKTSVADYINKLYRKNCKVIKI